MSYIIGNKCIGVKDSACIDACPIDECIVEGEESMYINPDLCIECGACLPSCPVDAIYDSEEEAIKYGEVKAVHDNYNFFRLKFKD
jgi:ferredoxin